MEIRKRSWRRHAVMLHMLSGMLILMLAGSALAQTSSLALDEPPSDWVTDRDDATGLVTQTMEMSIRSSLPTRPVLKHRLIPAETDRVDGNSALFYLKAMGFFEQNNAREKLNAYHRQQYELVASDKITPAFQKPYVWLEMPPSELPVEEVKEYLSLTSFQHYFLAEATKRRGFSMDRNIEAVESPLSYLLPEIQSFREVARTQSLRCRVAIVEGELDAALEILGQQFAMANHVGQDDFFVSALVGCAIEGIAASDALHFAQHADAPNLYWAYAALPRPIVDMRSSYAFETASLYHQVKALRDVTEEPRPAGFWSDLIDRMVPQLQDLELEGSLGIDGAFSEAVPFEVRRAALVSIIAASYPGARRYLIEDLEMDAALVDSYTTTQTVLLAVCKFHDIMRDEQYKWRLVDFNKAAQRNGFDAFERELEAESARIGTAARIATLLVPAMRAVHAAEERAQMLVSLLQTVEALRAHAAEHDGSLPPTLDNLRLPAPNNPFTGRPIDYELVGGKGVLTAQTQFLRQRLVLSVRD